jgi:hypothetical protein
LISSVAPVAMPASTAVRGRADFGGATLEAVGIVLIAMRGVGGAA